jgi:hypothetical protein
MHEDLTRKARAWANDLIIKPAEIHNVENKKQRLAMFEQLIRQGNPAELLRALANTLERV